MNEFYIYITFDIDQDFDPKSKNYYNRSKAKFNFFDKNFSKLIDKLDNIPFSVFIRSDYQIKTIYGSYDYLFEKNSDVIEEINQSNGEINWHIHLYEQVGEKWLQIKDEQQIVESFLKDYAEVRKIKGLNSHIVRIGECVMTDALMNTIDKSGITIDSTALPGRKRNDAEKSFDWEITTNEIYHPSKLDYRKASDTNYSLIEVPMSTLMMKTHYDNQPIKRYFNLAFKTEILFQSFDEYITNNNTLVTVTHPFEVLAEGNHGLVSYDLSVFEKNLKLLRTKVAANGKKAIFKKISKIL